ncbi:sensor histidine kinase [Clostridium autoethanogenum]|uniref:histidine kinase n=2 Tax=Clostridium autoethanogenum TaxID=84023 RepID=A0A3M0SMF0_9CLOT|nr:HAMP domain-containing sensor histidine kinase [Clostridium autoethanogenum]AGY77805.1 HAMP domain-containing histidine kinase [Clostridium autoethanogenum DSM 10061]ALU37939.1 Histidine kinase [Clostridium autoethanogenum DSM 10061]OVY50703.1 putative sensor histidine kinase TcrY [Clostridium autoethanogenum]RMC99485.1 sensor histidine kinase [Clostridium autoethanogenum]
MFFEILKNLRKKFKRLYITMFKNYIIFVFLMLLVLSGTIGFMIFSIGKMVSSEDYIKDTQKFFMASKIVKSDYKKIDASKIVASKGWVEILNSNKKVIYVIGTKKDKVTSYTENELLNFMDLSYNNLKSGTSYFYSVTAFNSNGEDLYCIVKVPPGIVTLNVDIAPSPDKYIKKAAIYILVGIFIIIVFLTVSVFLYAYLTTKKVVMPLKKILQGIKRMTEEDYSTRINFNAENEFGEIRDAFNFMAEKIEASIFERNRMENLKQQLLSDISHDLKTPLTSIMGYSKALNDGVVENDKKIKQYLNIIYNKSKRTVSLIENLHEFTKLDNSKFLISKEECDFCEFVREIVSEYYNEFEEKNFELEINLPEDEIIYEFDKVEMERAISNIISNILKYNEVGTKAKIELTYDNSKIQLIIADDGVGIDESLKENIFEPFVRGDKSRYTKGGTGLGLSIANKIVQKHGGTLTLEKCKKYKTVFRLKL